MLTLYVGETCVLTIPKVMAHMFMTTPVLRFSLRDLHHVGVYPDMLAYGLYVGLPYLYADMGVELLTGPKGTHEE